MCSYLLNQRVASWIVSYLGRKGRIHFDLHHPEISVELGPFSWKKRKAFVWDTLPEQLRDFDGMIGPAALDAQVIAFDFDRRVISLEIP
jgi:hypothetical protein